MMTTISLKIMYNRPRVSVTLIIRPTLYIGTLQNSIVVCSLYFAKCICCFNIGVLLQLTCKSLTTRMHESTMIPYIHAPALRLVVLYYMYFTYIQVLHVSKHKLILLSADIVRVYRTYYI